MVRKGQIHVMDAIVAVMVLMFFSITNFGSDIQNDWSGFENQIAADDLSYTLKETGYVNDFVREGNVGNLETALNSISERDLGVGGEIRGVPPNLDIGYFTVPSKLDTASVRQVNSGDPCYSEVQNNLRTGTAVPILRTVSGGSSMESSNDGITLYIGDNIDDGVVQYNAIWIDRGTQCDFPNADKPVMREEIFQWGTTPTKYFEFRNVEMDTDTEGRLNLAKADQMKRIQETMQRPVNNIDNRVKIDSFKMTGNTQTYDIVVFPGTQSITHIQNEGLQGRVKQLARKKPTLFLADLTESEIEGGLLEDLGFTWKDIDYRSLPEANCNLDGGKSINNCGTLEVGFSDSENSNTLQSMMLGQETDMSQLSLYPEGSVVVEDKGVLSQEKILYLENYAYSEISEDRIKGLSSTTVSGRPSTSCNEAASADFQFPNSTGDLKSMNVVSTQLGTSASYCVRNIRAVYINRNGDTDYADSGEGPFQSGQQVTIRGLQYVVRTYTSSDSECGSSNCVGFILSENAKLNLFSYNPENRVGRTSYEQSYSQTDRKAIAGLMYTMAGSTDIPSNSEGSISTEIYGSAGENVYRLILRWSN